MIKETLLALTLLAAPLSAEYIPIDKGVLIDQDAITQTEVGFSAPAAIVINDQILFFFIDVDCLYDRVRYSEDGMEWTEWRACDNESPFFSLRLKSCIKRMV